MARAWYSCHARNWLGSALEEYGLGLKSEGHPVDAKSWRLRAVLFVKKLMILQVLLRVCFYFFPKECSPLVNNSDISCINFGVTVWTYWKYLVNLSCSSISLTQILYDEVSLWDSLGSFPVLLLIIHPCLFFQSFQQFFFMSYFLSPAKFHSLSQSSTLYSHLLQTAIL